MITKGIFALLLSLFFSVCLNPQSFAQSQTTGRIAGRVIDENRAAVVGAEIKVFRKATGDTRKFTTDLQGNYSALSLPPGTYQVTFMAEGFASVVSTDVEVIISETTTLSVQLDPAGPSTKTVEVRGASLLQSDGP